MASEIGVQKLMHTNATQAATINSSGQLIIDDGLHKSEGGAVNTSIQKGLAKAWFNMNGTSTPANRDSFNIASITDNGTGDYTHSFTSSFDNTDYAMGGWTGYPGSRAGVFGEDSSGIAYATGSFRMETAYISGTNGESTNMDVTYNNQMFMGDLA